MKKLFINLSNHPSEKWDASQKTAAAAFGEIHDIPFPQVSPSFSEDEIMTLAKVCFNKIKLLAGTGMPIVHVMGEMTLTYAIVTLCKNDGIKCVASTTERITEEKDDAKISFFKFIRFREY